METVKITAVRENRISEGATGLATDIQDTPQSITVIDRNLMDDFAADTINDALDLATGLHVERWETNRTNYTSRGFEIKSTQVDGVGMPNNWGLVEGEIDAYGYEKIEVIRGANGLLTGIGNASGTINYVRKRPTNTAQGEVGIKAGSYDSVRLEADYSTPFSASGAWAGRVVTATEKANSHIHGKSDERAFFYGVIDGQLTENSTLAIGYSYQRNNTDGNMWGGLVFTNSDGTQAEWHRSATTAQKWAYWDNINENAFIEYLYLLPNNWEIKLSYDHRVMESDSELFFASTSTGLDPVTGEGLTGWPGKWPLEDRGGIYGVKVNGDFSLFGERHQLVMGYSHATTARNQYTHPFDPAEPAFGPLPAFPYPLNAVPEPRWGARVLDSETDDKLKRLYAASQFNMGRLALVLGVNAVDFKRESSSLGNDLNESEISPYAGVTFDLNENVMLYTSYSDIYQPQDFYDINREYLAPTKGVNYEAGLKSTWLEQRLAANLAVFKAEQKGLGIYAGLDPSSGQYFYEGQDVFSEGFEVELNGKLNEYTTLLTSFVYVDMEDDNGDHANTWVPKRSAKMALSARLPQHDNITLGGGGRWQSRIHRVDGYTGVDVSQREYLTLDAFASWRLLPQSTLKLNVRNITNEKYITSLYEIGYYSAPRTYELSYKYDF